MNADLPFRYLAISDRDVCPVSVPERIHELDRLGVPAIQVRDKTLSDAERFEWIRELELSQATVLINGRADLARIGRLDGVHLPSGGLPASAVRPIANPNAIVGRSTHNLHQIELAVEEDLDYVLYGPIFPTPSKPDLDSDDIPGLEGLREATNTFNLPVLALGGVTPDRVEVCLEAGAYGVAGIRALFQPRNPVGNWNRIERALKSTNEDGPKP